MLTLIYDIRKTGQKSAIAQVIIINSFREINQSSGGAIVIKAVGNFVAAESSSRSLFLLTFF
jgi:hypothetical protein